MTRQRIFQQSPQNGRVYASFPTRQLNRDKRVYRGHRRGNGPWWFSSTGEGRFDLDPPDGTCYLSGTRAGAVRELVGPDLADHGYAPRSLLAERVISKLSLPVATRAADLSSNQASDQYGVTAELVTMTPYDIPHQWAATLHRAGFDALVCKLRFSAGNSQGIALFGTAGLASWPADPTPTDCQIIATRMKLNIVDPPDDDQLTVVSP